MTINPIYFSIMLISTTVATFALGCVFMRRRMKLKTGQTDITKDCKDFSHMLNYDTNMWSIFIDSMPIHVFIKNADDNFRYVYSNKTRNNFFGLNSDELIGKNDLFFLPIEKAKSQLAADLEIMTKPQGVYRGLYEGIGLEGKKRIFRIVQTQFTDKNGTHLLLGAALDITENEESRRSLAEAISLREERERWLSRTLQSIGDAVIVTDKQGNTVLMNPVAERLTGVKADNAIGKPHDEVFHIVDSTNYEPRLSPVARALRTGSIVELANNTDLLSSEGDYYHISDSAAPIMDEQKNVLGAVLVFRDVTEAYQRRADLNAAVNNWEMASNVSNIASFRIDYHTRRVLGSSRRISEFWPIKDGIAVHAEEWVLQEDAARCRDLMRAIAEGRASHNFILYRARKNDRIHFYRIYESTVPEHPGEITGIIQDITESYESERQLENTRLMWNSLIDILPLNFFSKNADDHFRYTHCNKRFAEFVGRPVEDIIGKTDAELFTYFTESEQFTSQDIAIIKSGEARNFTESVQGGAKEQITYQTVKMPCIGPNGDRILLGVSIDITELAVLERSQEILRQGLEMLVAETDVNDGIAKSMKLVCEYMGVAHSYILHFDTEKQTTSCVREYCSQGEPALLSNLKDKPFSTGVDWHKHFENECFMNFPNLQNSDTLSALGPFYAKIIMDGDFRSLYCHRLIIDGKFWGYVGLAYTKNVRTLNQRELDFVQSAARFIELMIRHKRAQTELHDAVIKAQTAEKAKSSFLATMSHEIRTPLNAVIGFSELLKDKTLADDEKEDYLNDISIAGNSLLALINNILDISKLEAGKIQFVKKMTDFSKIVYEIIPVFKQKFKDKNLDSIVDIVDLPIVGIDPLRIKQVLFNLVGNAVKFTDTGSITISARFQPNDDKHTGTLRFSVKDTGCGISAEDQKLLFQPFVQSTAIAGTQKAGNGSGLGLLLVRRMLEFMNGEVSLESTPGVGSEFIVTIYKVEYSIQDKISTGEPLATNKEDCITNLRILLVDDMPLNQKVIKAILQHSKFKCVAVGSGAEALAALAKEPFDILLADMRAPGMNEMELVKEIRRSEKYPDLYIVVITSDTDGDKNIDSSIFDNLLIKPVNADILLNCIKRSCKK